MELKFSQYRIYLKHTFGISRSANDWYDIVYIYIVDGDIIGRGEAAPSSRYNESVDQILTILNEKVQFPEDCLNREKIWNFVLPQLNGIKALEAAFSMALWDWWSQTTGKSVKELLSISLNKMPLTSYTIAIGNLNEIEEKIMEAEPYSILKVKLGIPDKDMDIIKEIRCYTDKLIRVDANEGWNFDYAVGICNWLADQNVEFIEQPFPADQLNKTSDLKKISTLDIYADENSINSYDIPKIVHAFDGINIKLMKCGSMEEGKRMINLARKYGMKIMLGCMVESSVGITAAAHLAAEVDVVDLDGNLLINNDPYIGAIIENGRLVLPTENGLGTNLKTNSSNLM
tara:strand:- start:148 stop:1179 length:1032 start_codon:yes stop_codon:yes gene_type:complete